MNVFKIWIVWMNGKEVVVLITFLFLYLAEICKHKWKDTFKILSRLEMKECVA